MLTSVEWFVLSVIAILVIGVFWWSIYAFFQAIYLFIFSAWETEKVKKAWNSIRYMIVGVFLTLFLLFIFPIVFKRIQLPGYEAYTANNIFAHVSYLLRSVFSFWQEAATTYQVNGPAAGNGWTYDPYQQWSGRQPIVPKDWSSSTNPWTPPSQQEPRLEL